MLFTVHKVDFRNGVTRYSFEMLKHTNIYSIVCFYHSKNEYLPKKCHKLKADIKKKNSQFKRHAM